MSFYKGIYSNFRKIRFKITANFSKSLKISVEHLLFYDVILLMCNWNITLINLLQ